MFDRLRTWTLRLLRVPHDPDPPAGAPGSAHVFRAGTNFYKLRLVRWTVAQIGALVGIAFSLTFLGWLEQGVEEARAEVRRATLAPQPAPAVPLSPTPDSPAVSSAPDGGPPAARAANARTRSRSETKQRTRSGLRRMVERWPTWIFPLLKLVEWGGIFLYVVQIPLTYAMARLDYELRWYIVTDRSLRIRAGLTSVQEITMSFANVQQVIVSQGPLQRVLGIADVRVQSAGGGGDEREHGGHDQLHTGVFHGVDNANEIRDLILDRLRLFRQAGLGDPDDVSPALGSITAASRPGIASAVTAAQELLQEARALRQIIR
jgi:hypothetical protein